MKPERLDQCDYCKLFVSVDELAIVDVPHPPFEPVFCCRKRCQRHVINLIRSGKGLEWPVVFLPGLEEDNLPHWNAVRSGPAAIEEERRLFYVGATRARRQLIISSSGRRGTFTRTPSRFLQGFNQQRFVKMERVSA